MLRYRHNIVAALQMGDLTLLPDGTIFLCNGAQIGKYCIISSRCSKALFCRHLSQQFIARAEVIGGISEVLCVQMSLEDEAL